MLFAEDGKTLSEDLEYDNEKAYTSHIVGLGCEILSPLNPEKCCHMPTVELLLPLNGMPVQVGINPITHRRRPQPS